VKGCVRKRLLPSGRLDWFFSVRLGKDETGKRIREYRSGFRRKADAEAALRRFLQEIDEGAIARPAPRSFGDFIEEWFTEHAARQCTPKTLERYRQLAAYVLRHLGKVQLADLTALMLERLYNRLHDSGGKKGASLSARTVRHIAGVVHAALTTAVRWKLLRVNPAGACQLPKAQRKEAKVVEKDQLEWLLNAAQGHWLYPIILVASATGCRRGEILALTWADLDLKSEVAKVSITKSLEQTRAGLRLKPPKNGKPRLVPLPDAAREALTVHRQQQDGYRRMFGPDYRSGLDLVFATPEGDYLKPDSITAKFCLLARKAGLKRVSLHSLRHSHSSLLLSLGIPLPVVSKRLGHTTPAVTASIYSHPLSRDEVAAASLWDESMRHATRPKATQ